MKKLILLLLLVPIFAGGYIIYHNVNDGIYHPLTNGTTCFHEEFTHKEVNKPQPIYLYYKSKKCANLDPAFQYCLDGLRGNAFQIVFYINRKPYATEAGLRVEMGQGSDYPIVNNIILADMQTILMVAKSKGINNVHSVAYCINLQPNYFKSPLALSPSINARAIYNVIQ